MKIEPPNRRHAYMMSRVLHRCQGHLSRKAPKEAAASGELSEIQHRHPGVQRGRRAFPRPCARWWTASGRAAGMPRWWWSTTARLDNTAEPSYGKLRLSAPEIRLLENPANRGKGYSVRHGILHALGDIVMFTDADLSSPIEEADGLFAAIAEGADIAIGSRWLATSRQTHRQPLYRPILRALLQPADAHGDEPALRRYAVRFQSLYPPRGPDRVSAPDHRALGIRPGDPLYRPQARLSASAKFR